MTETFHVKEYPSGLTLLGMPMPLVSSAAFTIALPGGAAYDPEPALGAGNVGIEWLFRGAGDMDTRALNDALEALGCDHGESVRSTHLVLSAVQLGRNLPKVLEIYADILRRPRLEDQTFQPSRQLALQDVLGLEDEPARKANILLREKFYPSPLGRCVFGHEQTLRAMTAEPIRAHLNRCLSPNGAIVSVAGNFEWDTLVGHVDELLGDWTKPALPPLEITPPENGVNHLEKDSAQSHIAMGHATVPLGHEHYYSARLAETVLSGGMASRLFTEVREKRGLAYSVGSSYHCVKDHAGIFTYVGTRPELTQETFDVTTGEIRRLAEGIDGEEMQRARVQLKSGLVMQGESTRSRAGSMASDWYLLGQVRTLEQIARATQEVTIDQVMDYLRQMPATDFTVLVIGPEGVSVDGANG
ncbi:MAG: M16 family metallopeptidase [Phycisphaerae bacterium]